MVSPCQDSCLERNNGHARTPVEQTVSTNTQAHKLSPHERRRTSRRSSPSATAAVCALLACTAPLSFAQSCISLSDSTTCPAFSAASISTDSKLTGLFPFLSSVTDTSSFDSGLTSYIARGFTQLRYRQLIGCSNVNLDNTTAFYARYTTSVLCNAIVQNSINACGLTGDATTPLCANTCADYAESEQEIVASDVCGNAGSNALTQIRADFTNCALPADSITGSCIEGYMNEKNDCGYSDNLGGLCSYCAASSPNSTDSCCVFSDTTSRCVGVVLPVVATASLTNFIATATATATATPSGDANSHSDRLSKGAIAAIVIGSVVGIAAFLALIIFACLFVRRRRQQSPATSVFNQPYQGRAPPPTSYHDGTAEMTEGGGLSLLGGGRVARMAALEGPYGLSSSSSHDIDPTQKGSTSFSRGDAGMAAAAAAGGAGIGAAAAAAASHRNSPPHNNNNNNNDTSPSSNGGDYTSPDSHGQSEQLDFFKDYYSSDEIRPGQLVSTLWAYEPRAADEFQLERGDMIKVLGIWDDGWATGTRSRQRAAEWRRDDDGDGEDGAAAAAQRDSGLSTSQGGGGGERRRTLDDGEVKAFPLVCVCLPQHWGKTIEGDSTEEGGGPNF